MFSPFVKLSKQRKGIKRSVTAPVLVAPIILRKTWAPRFPVKPVKYVVKKQRFLLFVRMLLVRRDYLKKYVIAFVQSVSLTCKIRYSIIMMKLQPKGTSLKKQKIRNRRWGNRRQGQKMRLEALLPVSFWQDQWNFVPQSGGIRRVLANETSRVLFSHSLQYI